MLWWFLHPPVQFVHRYTKQLGSLGIGNGPLGKCTERESFKPLWLLALHRERLLVRRLAPPEATVAVEQPPEKSLVENAKLSATVGERLNAYAEESFQLEKLTPTDGFPMFADFLPKGIGRHQEGSGETLGGLLLVQIGAYVHDQVSKLMGQGKTLAFPPVPAVHHNDGHRAVTAVADPRRQTIDVRQIDGKHLDALFLQQLDQVGDRIVAEVPVIPQV